jgi:hypothetical protein
MLKVKLFLDLTKRHAMKTSILLTSPLDEGVSLPGRFTPGKEPPVPIG